MRRKDVTLSRTDYDDLLEKTCGLPRIGRPNQDDILSLKAKIWPESLMCMGAMMARKRLFWTHQIATKSSIRNEVQRTTPLRLHTVRQEGKQDSNGGTF